MCNVTTLNKEDKGKITVEFDRRADLKATEVFVINQGPEDDSIEVGVSLICTDNGKILDIEQLPVRKPKGVLPEPPVFKAITAADIVDMVSAKEIRAAWGAVKAMSFFKRNAGECVEACRLKSTMCEITRMNELLKEE